MLFRSMTGALYLDPNPKDVLIIGLGGGTLAATLSKLLPEARIDAVEVDKAVINVADKFFNVRPSEQIAIHAADGICAQTVTVAINTGTPRNAPDMPHRKLPKNTANRTMNGESDSVTPATRGSR